MARILAIDDNKDNLDESTRLKSQIKELTESWRMELSERVRAEEALKESEEKYRTMVDLLPEAVVIHEGGKIVFANAVALRTMGADSLNQLTEKAVIEFVHPDYRPMALDRIRRIHSTGLASEFTEEKFITLRNEVLDVEVIGIPIQFMGKSAVQTIIRDITARKRAEITLKENEAQFRKFFEKASDAIFIAEIESGIIVDANEAASRLLQLPREQIIKLHQSQIHPKTSEEFSKETFREHNYRAKQNLTMIPSENEIIRPDGSLVPVEIMASEVIYQNKNCLMGTFRDITERKQADIKLRESEYFFRESQRAAFVGSYKFDLRNDFWSSSEVLEQIFGIDKNYDRNLQSWLEIIHPDDREMMARYFSEEVIANRQVFNKEYRIISQFEGETRWVLGLGKLNFDAEGNIIEMIGTIQDITERKLSQVALQESEEKYSILFKDSPDAYLIITDAIITDCNRATEVMFGGGRKQIIGKQPDELSPEFQPDGRKSSIEAQERIEFALKNGKNTFEWIHKRFDGTDFYAEVTIAPTIFQGKSALFTTLRDINERKQAEKKLKESQQLFHELFNASPDAIVLIDPHHPTVSWPIVDCNEAACRMNGFTREEMIGKSIDLLNLTAGSPDERMAYLNSLRQKDVLQTESIHHHKDGHAFPVEISTSVITIEGREMVLGIDRDITERKQAEEAVHLSEVRLKRAELTSKSGNWEFYLATKILNASEGAAKVFGVKGQQYSYEMIKEISLPEYRPILDAALKNLIKNDIPYDVEFKIAKVDTGEIKDIHSVAFFDKEKRVLFGIIQDITDRKQAEAELIKSEERYRRFISQVSEGVYRFEGDEPMDIGLPVEEQIDFIYDHMFIAECNQAFKEMYGIADEKEMIGKSHIDFHGGRNNPVNRNALREFIINGYRIENALTEEINDHGQLRYFSNNSLGTIENNQLVRMWGTQTDITEKTKSDKVQQVLYTISNAAISSTDLADLVEIISIQLSKLLDASNFYIAFYDEASGMLSTQYNKDEVDQIDFWPAEKSATGYVIKNQKSLLASKADVMKLYEEGEIELIGTPSEIWLGVPLVLGKKAIGAIVVQSYDNPNAYTEKDQLMLEFISDQICISLERKKAEQEVKEALLKAQESDRLKSAFLANMSHEIRTPLNAIIGFSELIRDPAFEPEQQDEFAQLINDSGNNLLSILSDIMDISKIEAGQVDVVKRKVSVNKLITSIQKEFVRKADKKGVELRLNHANPVDMVEIETDETKIRQIIGNFLSNALKFTEEGFIELGIEPEEKFVRLYVKDTGIGIPIAYHDKIFERFRQVETSHTRKYGGNGLGLCISKNLIELLGGTIGMESEEGKGSIFYITIPRN